MRVSIDERLARLCADFSVAKIGEWLERKFTSYDTSKADVISIAENKNDKEYFKSARLLGYVRDLPDGRAGAGNRPLLVAAVEMRKALTERTSRQAQFNFAKRVLQNAVRGGASGLNGYPSQGLFFFFDSDQFFRISLVSGEMDGRKFKFNEAKRQSFYINPDRPNNIAKSRLSESIETYADLKEAFSVETLTKEFYGKLFEWYEWAMKPKTGVTFPNDASTRDDDKKYNNESVIRLITRLMFTWFIRQRDMVREELFTVEGVTALLKNFDPKSMEDDNYYRCILQNLFFATFNCQPEKRGFIKHKQGNGYSDQHTVKTLYRYEKEFKDSAAFKELVKKTPFLNCALFDCLDKRQRDVDGGKLLLFDGFSDTRKRQAHVPNGLFFHSEKGIIPLFDTYEFTIDENNADDADVALDPELLGKVFENLLGAFNPETQETARKATGSFYTPREIVGYMVEESLKNHIKTKVPRIKDAWLAELFDKTAAAEKRELPFGDDVVAEIRESLYSCKILDPACGSGAFPMGILHCMVRLFSRLDPSNIDLNKRLIARYKQETDLPPDPLETAADREERLEALKVQLDEGQHYPDYARKLYLIENCIYGVDIQPIATQISKLRFFISLLCDQLRENWNAESENHGLLSLPNLEAKFVCANTLISLPKTEGELELMSCSKIPKLREKLQENRHRIFAARTYKQKEKLKVRDFEIRDEIREAVRSTLAKPDKELIKVQEEVIAKLRKDRIPFETPKMVKRQKAVQADFFTATQDNLGFEMVDANKSKRDQIDAQIEFAQRKIDSELAKSSAANVTKIDQLASLVAGWDPYDQNASSSFFDPEWMFNISSGFDVVIGNPPYVQVPKGMVSSEDFPYAEGKDVGKQNLYKLFVEAGYNFASKNGGVISLIVQSSLMGDMSAKFTRELLLTQTQILCFIEFPKNAPTPEGKVFKGVLQGTCVVLFRRVIPVNEHKFGISINNDITTVDDLLFETLQQNQVMLFYPKNFEIPLILQGEGPVVEKVKSVNGRVKDYVCDTAQGNINTIHLKRISSNSETGCYIAKGAHIHRYGIDSNLYFCKDTRETKALFSRNTKKHLILTQNISGTTDRHRINAAPFECRNTRIVFLDSTNILYLSSPGDMKYICAVLNCRITDWIFRKTSTNNHLNMYELVEIPVPYADVQDRDKVIGVVDEIIAAKKKNPEVDTSVLEAQIDQLVYKLYGLTEEEIAIVEGRGKTAAAEDEAAAKPSCRRAPRPATAADSSREEDDEELE